MASCGMYDFSGEWLLRVGLPAKSGVSGGLLAVAPSQFGVAGFSPRLDVHGNSVRASAFVEIVSERFGMHLLEPHESVAAPGISVERDREGPLVRLGGELGFAGAERVLSLLREIAAAAPHGAAHHASTRSELARTAPRGAVALRDGVREPAAARPPSRVSDGRPRADQMRRSSVIDIASVLWRCGHSWARPDPSACGGRPGSASETLREHRRARRAPRSPPPHSRRTSATTPAVSARCGEQVTYATMPPGAGRRSRRVSSSPCSCVSSGTSAGDLRQRASGRRRSAPSPVHGASTRMRS